MITLTEVRESFACFGGECTVIVSDAAERDAARAVEAAKRALLEWHHRFSRFESDSELSQLNREPRETVSVSPLMRRVVAAGLRAAHDSGGLVNPTLVDELEAAGYVHSLGPGGALPLADALAAAPPRAPAAPDPSARYLEVEVDRATGTVTRPPGVKLDPGGIAKGVFADELATLLAGHGAFVVDCCGDLRVGGADGVLRDVEVESPFDGTTLHTYSIGTGAFATTGIGRRAWLDPDGRPAHHLLDPASGRPAFTGVVQATALAPTAIEAEMRSKAAVLSGPGGAASWLPHGGVVVLDDGRCLLL
ncbi:MAG TPA: FAD:protein FMN transferase [Solirubrobacteraceae bacterium]|nr:FAD:protein FMN transferase [Solirubrobacteraceae bacterium]